MFKILAVHDAPAFNIQNEAIHAIDGGWISLRNFSLNNSVETPYTLYVIINGQFISGPITPLINDILYEIYLSENEQFEKLIHKYGQAAFLTTVNQLTEMRLINF